MLSLRILKVGEKCVIIKIPENKVIMNCHRYVHHCHKMVWSLFKTSVSEICGEIKMTELNIKDYICNELTIEAQCVALKFVSFLEENGIIFNKDNCDCWKDKIYYWCKYKNDCVCFISIKDPDEPQNLWTVWSDDIKSEWLNKYDVDDEIKELAWKHIDHCGNCGSCGGGQRKVIFGREFKAVCGCTFRVDNPSIEDLIFFKKIIEIRITESVK